MGRLRTSSAGSTYIASSLVRSTPEPFGYVVIEARRPRQCLALARERRPDLILSDVHMPEGGGFALIRAVKAEQALRSIPFAFIFSTVDVCPDREEALALGADAFIRRPIEPGAFLAEIDAILDRVRKV